MITEKFIEQLKINPGKRFELSDRSTTWAETKEVQRLAKNEFKKKAQASLRENLQLLSDAQDLLYADDRYSLLVIFQAMDAAGKDSTIKHVLSGVNPQGCQVFSFKQPSAEELDHDFLWRCTRCLPERGRIGIFNRSYYEEVLVVRVHPNLLEYQKLPPGPIDDSFWQARYDDINNFEKHLVRNGTHILKFFLHMSKDEQKKRFLERLDDPKKNWKFAAGDVVERQHWKEYMDAYEQALQATSTKHAPWHVIPADNQWATRMIVADVIAAKLRSLDLRYPEPDRTSFAEAREKLLTE